MLHVSKRAFGHLKDASFNRWEEPFEFCCSAKAPPDNLTCFGYVDMIGLLTGTTFETESALRIDCPECCKMVLEEIERQDIDIPEHVAEHFISVIEGGQQ